MIAVIIARAVPDHLRGYLGRFLSEVVPGVFVGRTSPTVAERMWERTSKDLKTGSMAMVITDQNMEQGYSFRTAGTDPPEVINLDGLQLIATRYTQHMDDPAAQPSETPDTNP
ncbi:type I-E CRISPR-associated endoribonuclease Cas2e [Arthrobacter sp.]|uniref:type I-E CRISPR-associated endoribonuclease Cas2e n=1 Tax=Arthrobacter sp. TaxID=1667 RepID=UPI0034E8A6A8